MKPNLLLIVWLYTKGHRQIFQHLLCTNYTSQTLVEGQLIGFQNISINTDSKTHIQGFEKSAVIDVCEFSVAK